MTTWRTPICEECKHFDRYAIEGLVCAAFPKGIPKKIFETGDHSEPLPQQKNKLVFTPRRKK